MIHGYVLTPEACSPANRRTAQDAAGDRPQGRQAGVLEEAKAAGRRHFWLDRYHDFNVFSEERFKQKLRYLHRNRVKRGLVAKPEEWRWSSFCHYQTGLPGTVEIESWWTEQARVTVRGLRPEDDPPSSDRLPITP